MCFLNEGPARAEEARAIDPTLTADLVAIGRRIPREELANIPRDASTRFEEHLEALESEPRSQEKRALSDPTLWSDIAAMFASVPKEDWASVPHNAARRFDELIEGDSS